MREVLLLEFLPQFLSHEQRHICVSARTTTTTIAGTTAAPTCTSPCVCAGVSPYTLWQVYSTSGIFMNVNTSNCHFTTTPMYFTSIAGTGDHWNLVSHNAIYVSTSTSFRIYIRALASWSTSMLMNSSATNIWDVNWVGLYN